LIYTKYTRRAITLGADTKLKNKTPTKTGHFSHKHKETKNTNNQISKNKNRTISQKNPVYPAPRNQTE
jgi:hypothetical protein